MAARDPLRHKAQVVVANHRQRLRHPLQEFSYSVADVEQLLRAALGKPCPYCGRTLTLLNVSVDYKTPIGRGGPHQLANLVAVCRRDNTLKGSLLAWEYGVLVKALGEMTEESRKMVESALLVRGKTFGRRR
jgi:5-methylcytosine-specific restriction endonuclease McrA